jgi:hypothetical protein
LVVVGGWGLAVVGVARADVTGGGGAGWDGWDAFTAERAS